MFPTEGMAKTSKQATVRATWCVKYIIIVVDNNGKTGPKSGIQFLNAKVVRYSPPGTWSVNPNWALTADKFIN